MILKKSFIEYHTICALLSLFSIPSVRKQSTSFTEAIDSTTVNSSVNIAVTSASDSDCSKGGNPGDSSSGAAQSLFNSNY